MMFGMDMMFGMLEKSLSWSSSLILMLMVLSKMAISFFLSNGDINISSSDSVSAKSLTLSKSILSHR